MQKIELKQKEIYVLERLSGQGFCAYAVGGCVRDRIMGKIPLDTDITTSATPNQVKRVFCDYKVIETGIKHGTVTVLIDREPIEITTFRTDGEYKDSRHPESVEYTTSVESDLARRDFTINAMAYNQADGLIDLYNGKQDIENKIIRCVGDPKKRFCEDALRIMRAVRFAATLDFEIEPKTAAAMEECAALLKNVSAERIFIELKKLLCGKAADRVLRDYCFVIKQIIPEIADSIGFKQQNPHHIFDVYEHTVRVVGAAPAVAHLRLAALLHDIGKPACFELDDNGVGHFKGHAIKSASIAREALERLKSDKLTRERVCMLVENHNRPIADNKKDIALLLRSFGREALLDLLDLRDADNSAKTKKEADGLELTKRIRALVEEIVDENACIDIKQLDINGQELILLGVPKGESIGKALEALLCEVISNRLENKKDALTEYVKANLLGKDNGNV